jgi:hypothetical protein
MTQLPAFAKRMAVTITSLEVETRVVRQWAPVGRIYEAAPKSYEIDVLLVSPGPFIDLRLSQRRRTKAQPLQSRWSPVGMWCGIRSGGDPARPGRSPRKPVERSDFEGIRSPRPLRPEAIFGKPSPSRIEACLRTPRLIPLKTER